jgi:hypothetical protein
LADALFGLLYREMGAGREKAPFAERLQALAKLAENLDRLLVARKLLIQALTYTRYHVKLLPDRGRPRGGERRGARP